MTRFCPQRDEDGLLRISGRLRFADDLPHDVKHPIILPKDHPVTRLIIEKIFYIRKGDVIEPLTVLRIDLIIIKYLSDCMPYMVIA